MDFSRKMVKIARERAKDNKIKAKIIKSEAYDLPFKDGFFDSAIFIAALHCIETAENREKALQELYRTLKEGGEAMITVWSRNEERIKRKPKESMIPWNMCSPFSNGSSIVHPRADALNVAAASGTGHLLHSGRL